MSCIVDSWDSVPVVVEKVSQLVSWNLDSWEDEVEEVVPEVVVEEVKEKKVVEEVKTYVVRNRYAKYPYFVPSLKTTVLRTLYAGSLSELQRNLCNEDRLLDYVLCVRNGYLSSTYNVLKSTHFYNPITRSRVFRKKSERVDPGFSWVSLEDQRRVYQLFGFSGSNAGVDDSFRLEILEVLKNLLYQPDTLVDLIMYLLDSQDIQLDISMVQKVCRGLATRADYAYKCYKLPEKWYYNSSWKKLSNVSQFHSIIGGEGGRGAVEAAELDLQ